VNAVLFAWLLGMGVLGAAIEKGDAGELRLGDLLDNAANFDGRPIALQGTLGKLDVRVTRRGSRYYTFRLIQQGREVLVLVQDRPICKDGTAVRVHGRFDGPRKRVDATTVTCD
jgi:hypothetical protein